MAKQWEAAEAILAIVQAQYEQPKGIKPRYQPFVPGACRHLITQPLANDLHRLG